MRQHEKQKRDVDSAQTAFRIKAFAWALVPAVPGIVVGATLLRRGDHDALLTVAVATVVVVAVAYFGGLYLGERMGRIGGSLYFSGGSTLAGPRQYSLADSLLVRGQVDEAIAELQRAATQYAEDPEPCLRLARVLRDRCNRYEEAVRQFRQAIARTQDAGLETAALREIIEIYTHRLRTPRRALPDLSRLAHRYPDTPAGRWARGEYESIRAGLEGEDRES